MFCWIFLSSNLLKEELSGTPIVRSQRWAKFIQCQKRLETKQSRIQLHSIVKKKLGKKTWIQSGLSAKLQRGRLQSSRGIFDPHTGQLYRLSMSPKSTSHSTISTSAISRTKYDKYDLGFSMPPYDLLTVEREAVCFSSEATQAQACRDDLSCGTSEVHDFQRFRKVYLSIA